MVLAPGGLAQRAFGRADPGTTSAGRLRGFPRVLVEVEERGRNSGQTHNKMSTPSVEALTTPRTQNSLVHRDLRHLIAPGKDRLCRTSPRPADIEAIGHGRGGRLRPMRPCRRVAKGTDVSELLCLSAAEGLVDIVSVEMAGLRHPPDLRSLGAI